MQGFYFLCISFQLTTSQGGRLGGKLYAQLIYEYFNSRPHKEVDCNNHTLHPFIEISTHDLTRRSTSGCTCPDFQKRISTHDLTRRSTRYTLAVDRRASFQLTTSQGGRRLAFAIRTLAISHFNSRPHKEVDWKLLWNATRFNISTHDLTRRSTALSYCL